MIGRITFRMLLLPIIGISFIASYLVFSTGSFVLDHHQHLFITPFDYSSYKIWCVKNDTLHGTFEVISGDAIDLVAMDDKEFNAWTRGLYLSGIYVQLDSESHNWSVRIPSEGYYYVVYSNEDSSTPVEAHGSFHIASSRNFIGPIIIVTVLFGVQLTIVAKLAAKTMEWADIWPFLD
ncbi:MAG: hypothetical protein JSW05_01320 [Candidatus Thorarchaeota archaeon]|nr:MAG: hypothetical protein JSW05_01320 [Candidatus Thorarchaeota archaeon]